MAYDVMTIAHAQKIFLQQHDFHETAVRAAMSLQLQQQQQQSSRDHSAFVTGSQLYMNYMSAAMAAADCGGRLAAAASCHPPPSAATLADLVGAVFEIIGGGPITERCGTPFSSYC